jgi:hypothetical protein
MAPVLLPCSRSAHDLVFLIVDVRDAFEEEQREHIGLEIGCIHRAAKDVGGFPKVGLELAQTHCRIIHKKREASIVQLSLINWFVKSFAT